MAIVNRDLDASEQKYTLSNTLGALAAGLSAWVGLVPSPGQVLELKITAKGLSATPVYQLAISRWTSGGVTGIALGTAVTIAGAFGLSGGALGATYAFSSSVASVQAGDLLVLNTSGANTAATDVAVGVVIQATQDIKKSFDV